MAKPGETGLTRIISASHNSFKGLSACWLNEAAFRQELLLCLILVPLGLYLGNGGGRKITSGGRLFSGVDCGNTEFGD